MYCFPRLDFKIRVSSCSLNCAFDFQKHCQNIIPQICGIPNNLFVAGTSYEVPGVRPGWGEYARHGLPHTLFQADFDAAARCNYRMDWNSGYDKGAGQAAFNVVYHQNSPKLPWLSHRMLTKSQLSQKKTQYGNSGYKLVHIDVYRIGSSNIRYAAIWKKGLSRRVPKTLTYHGVSASQHQRIFNSWTKKGWKPRVISVASVRGNRVYAAVYTKQNIGSWLAKSQLPSAQYQTTYNAQKKKGRRLVYLKSYEHNNQPYYSAIFASKAEPVVYAKHGLTSGQYQTHFNQRVGAGYKTGAVSAVRIGVNTRWAAYWEK